MQTEQFWRELGSEFSTLGAPVGAGLLHADLDNTSPDEIAALVEVAAIRAISAETADAAYNHARYAARGADAILDGRYVRGYWVVSGGPTDKLARRVLQSDFRLLAARAAIAAGVLGSKFTPEQAEQSWLHLIRERGSDFVNSLQMTRVCEASAQMCRELAVEAALKFAAPQPAREQRLKHEENAPDQAEPVRVSNDVEDGNAAGTVSHLARNITRFRLECGLTIEALAEKVGLSKDAVIDHVKHGAQPRPDALHWYAEVFSALLEREITVEELLTG